MPFHRKQSRNHFHTNPFSQETDSTENRQKTFQKQKRKSLEQHPLQALFEFHFAFFIHDTRLRSDFFLRPVFSLCFFFPSSWRSNGMKKNNTNRNYFEHAFLIHFGLSLEIFLCTLTFFCILTVYVLKQRSTLCVLGVFFFQFYVCSVADSRRSVSMTHFSFCAFRVLILICVVIAFIIGCGK